ncbi:MULTISPECIES: DUF2487 family protein [Bacillus]|uniref:DUF2487 domain-containing protein n=2 Tax=Bacillus TaxID=1386 RepID=A0A0M3R9G6_9BACI|nr:MULTISPECIES: DUF2487 family protein [Bacillus]ALC81402.1 hypothetical protein AM592_07190 [Bacillus gobiensis]MBP1080434.1 hypothetical protein [Bacillus capparidis]MED1094291.1 DUF2487 family protein [Bacillus capparidis]
MKWRAKDAELYLHSKEYIDTAIIPIVSVQLDSNWKSIVTKGEYTSLITEELERQLKGRVFLFPSSTYVEKEFSLPFIRKLGDSVNREFRHVVFITTEEEWKDALEEFQVITIPHVPLEDLSTALKQKMVQDQIEKILNILLQYWNGS